MAQTQTEQNLLYILLQYRESWDLLQQIDPEWFQHPILRGLYERVYDNQRDVREGADPPSDLFGLVEDESFRHWLSRILLLPMRRFGGEIGDFDLFLEEALRLQILKLRKQAVQRHKQRIGQDLQAILNESPAGDGQLAMIDRLSRENIQEWAAFLDTAGPKPS